MQNTISNLLTHPSIIEIIEHINRLNDIASKAEYTPGDHGISLPIAVGWDVDGNKVTYSYPDRVLNHPGAPSWGTVTNSQPALPLHEEFPGLAIGFSDLRCRPCLNVLVGRINSCPELRCVGWLDATRDSSAPDFTERNRSSSFITQDELEAIIGRQGTILEFEF